jgi:hypothetical protein
MFWIKALTIAAIVLENGKFCENGIFKVPIFLILLILLIM